MSSPESCFVWKSEIEFERGSTEAEDFQEGGSVSIEFATLDFLLLDADGARSATPGWETATRYERLAAAPPPLP